ncbi:MAG: citrate lyase acyl carrier protein, partial [Acidaminococcaceae bacterium]|nr:citrate lyase acyl carrier protein [Acidaminococcaceae bacterium]
TIKGGVNMVFRGHEFVAGTNNKGDTSVTLEIMKSGGIKIEIISKALTKYGQSIENSIREILSKANVEHARIAVEDYGALDFVIQARTETAVQRALAEKE